MKIVGWSEGVSSLIHSVIIIRGFLTGVGSGDIVGVLSDGRGGGAGERDMDGEEAAGPRLGREG